MYFIYYWRSDSFIYFSSLQFYFYYCSYWRVHYFDYYHWHWNWRFPSPQWKLTETLGIKSNVSALVAEQCTGTERFLKRLASGEWVIVDPAVTAERIYLYFYMAINLGSLGGVGTVMLEHKVGFWA